MFLVGGWDGCVGGCWIGLELGGMAGDDGDGVGWLVVDGMIVGDGWDDGW